MSITTNILLIDLSLIGDLKAGMTGLLVLLDQKPVLSTQDPTQLFTAQTPTLSTSSQVNSEGIPTET